MNSTLRPGASIGVYVLSIVAALLVHVVVAWLFSGRLDIKLLKPTDPKDLTPVIKASLVVVEPKKAAAKKPKPKPVKRKPPVKKAVKKPAPVVAKEEVPKKQVKEIVKKEAPKTPATLSEELFAEEDEILQQEQELNEVQQYIAEMTQLIQQYWSRPPSARNGMEALLEIELIPSGDVISVRIKRGSGNAAFDRSAILAVEKIGRFDILQSMSPKLFHDYFRKIDLTFRPEDLRL
jgi:colicin import membrane protein